jgi:hypothetical protein
LVLFWMAAAITLGLGQRWRLMKMVTTSNTHWQHLALLCSNKLLQ